MNPDTLQPDLAEMRRRIDSNTIMASTYICILQYAYLYV
jgi:hypothetical protein